MNVLLIPAFKPQPDLLSLVREIKSHLPDIAVVLVDDGSGPGYQSIFDQCETFLNVTIVRHAVNQGKGAALKTGIDFAVQEYPALDGIVTADADGQHSPADIIRVLQVSENHPRALILGVRKFHPNVPLRSRFGNQLTRLLVRFLVGQPLTDTQTGLRAIPRHILPVLLKLPSRRYEFELEMLIAAKHYSCPIIEQEIQTIYVDNNASSHFNPLMDSLRIYFVLFRFTVLSFLTAIVDNSVFFLVHYLTGMLGLSQIIGRAAAILFNYRSVRRAVFLSNEPHRILFPKYILLVLVNGLLAYGLIRLLHENFNVPILVAKLSVESALFFVNFVIQRDFIFKRKNAAQVSAPNVALSASKMEFKKPPC